MCLASLIDGENETDKRAAIVYLAETLFAFRNSLTNTK